MKFEKVARFADVDLPMPTRATKDSAGYDLSVAEDIIIPPYITQMDLLLGDINNGVIDPLTLKDISDLSSLHKARPTLVSTGMKCQLDENTYLQLSVRSSLPLKHWLILANSQGIIDRDYYGNSTNDGEIFMQLINLSPFPIALKRGDCIGQGIIHSYLTVENDNAEGVRNGGFGSTSEKK